MLFVQRTLNLFSIQIQPQSVRLCVFQIQKSNLLPLTARQCYTTEKLQVADTYCTLATDHSSTFIAIWPRMVRAGLSSKDEKTVRSIFTEVGLTMKMASAIWTASFGLETNGSIYWRHLARQNFESTLTVESMSSTVRFLLEMRPASTDCRCLVIAEMRGKVIGWLIITTWCSQPMIKTMTRVAATVLRYFPEHGGTSIAISQTLMGFMESLTVRVFSGPIIPTTWRPSQRWSYAVCSLRQVISPKGMWISLRFVPTI